MKRLIFVVDIFFYTLFYLNVSYATVLLKYL